MTRHIFLYGALLAATAFALEWLDFNHAVRDLSTSFYIVAIALLFAAIGVWVGNQLTARPRPAFERNERAIAALGVSARELDVLALLAEGCSNKVIARKLAVSPNTVKTHVQRVYEKLGVANRTQAAAKARELMILP